MDADESGGVGGDCRRREDIGRRDHRDDEDRALRAGGARRPGLALPPGVRRVRGAVPAGAARGRAAIRPPPRPKPCWTAGGESRRSARTPSARPSRTWSLRPAPGTTAGGRLGLLPSQHTGRWPGSPPGGYRSRWSSTKPRPGRRNGRSTIAYESCWKTLRGLPQAYDPPTHQWTTTYGAGAGLIVRGLAALRARLSDQPQDEHPAVLRDEGVQHPCACPTSRPRLTCTSRDVEIVWVGPVRWLLRTFRGLNPGAGQPRSRLRHSSPPPLVAALYAG